MKGFDMGFFSWNTLDTNESISNIYSVRDALPVVMVNPKTGEMFEELNYDGYGVFGGKDYYELLGELNETDEDGVNMRSIGIALELGNNGNNEYIAPLLLTYKNKNDWKKYVGQKPTICPFQGFFYE
jgi:hypothetical protein